MASVIYEGPLLRIQEAYDVIMRWIDSNGYHIVGPAREVYLRPAKGGNQNDPKTVTEIQFPVEKR